jgi:hypothetical protein
MWNNHMTKSLPCINAQQFAEKIISKDQQPQGIVGLSSPFLQQFDWLLYMAKAA